jgi:hypothetical protein
MSQEELDDAYIREHLSYDEKTGNLFWIKNPRNKKIIGDVAGALNSEGYLHITANMKRYKAHRIAWFLSKGYWPNNYIDHINGIKTDNRISNLRVVTHRENMRNTTAYKTSKTGVKGVVLVGNSYIAKIGVNYKNVHIGSFKTLYEAKKAYEDAALKLHQGILSRPISQEKP